VAIVRNILKDKVLSETKNKAINPNNMNYLNYLKDKNSSPNTITIYQQVINKYYVNQPLTTENISKFIKKLTKNKEPATCQLYLASLISYSKYLKTDESIE
jgi:hypothetical protein